MDDSQEPTLVQKVTLAHRALKDGDVEHAFGGALALAYYGEPRVTVDIDLNVFVGVDQIERVLAAFEPFGAGEGADESAARRDEQIRIWWGRNPVDLFFSYDPFHDAMEKAARWVPFDESRIPILSPEHLIVCKAAFDRPKDWVDIEQMLIGEADLDESEIFEWLERILGTDEDRVARLKEIWSRVR